MNKTKWLEMELPLTQEEIWERLNACSYSDIKGYGLDLKNAQDDFFEGVFIQKIIDYEEVVDPFGVEEVFSTVRYDQVDFSLFLTSSKKSLLRINKSGRSIKFFLRFISGVLGFGVSISAIKLDVLSLIKMMSEELSESKFNAKKVRLVNISISKGTIMRAEVVSNDNALTDIYSFFDTTSFLIDRVSGNFEKEGVSYFLDVSKSGLILYQTEIEGAVLKTVARIVNQ